MRSMKFLGPAALLLIVAASFAPGHAFAADGKSTNLNCFVGSTDPDCGASGSAKVTKTTKGQLWGVTVYYATVSATCYGLTPGASYTIVGTNWWFVADSNGDLKLSGMLMASTVTPPSGVGIAVARYYADNNPGLPVLTGSISF